jgi:6-phospho-3-hexuloisomerase
MSSLYHAALGDLARVFDRIDQAAVDRAVAEIAAAKTIALHGVGREGLQIKGLAMRLFHLGLKAAKAADIVLPIPAQTMADDTGASVSVLPMGSLFEGAQYIVFEVMILLLRDRLGVTPEAMRANHTNLE